MWLLNWEMGSPHKRCHNSCHCWTSVGVLVNRNYKGTFNSWGTFIPRSGSDISLTWNRNNGVYGGREHYFSLFYKVGTFPPMFFSHSNGMTLRWQWKSRLKYTNGDYWMDHHEIIQIFMFHRWSFIITLVITCLLPSRMTCWGFSEI